MVWPTPWIAKPANCWSPRSLIRSVNWTTGVDMDPESARPMAVRRSWSPNTPLRTKRRGRQHHGHLSGGVGHQGSAACGLQPADRTVLRADQPRLHGLRAVPRQLHRRPALCRRHAVDVSGPGQRMAAWVTSSPGTISRARSSGRYPRSSRCGRALWPPRATWCSTVRWKAILKAVDAKTGEELYKFKTPSGIIGNVMTYSHNGKQHTSPFCRGSAAGPGSALRPV